MSTYTIRLYANDNADNPAAGTGGYRDFNLLECSDNLELHGDFKRAFDNSPKQNAAMQKTYEVKFLPFGAAVENHNDYNHKDDLEVLFEMLNEPYLVIADCDLPEYTDASFPVSKYLNPMPVRVVWNGELSRSTNPENGAYELTVELEKYYAEGVSEPEVYYPDPPPAYPEPGA